ncbi:MAG: UDP-galactopyranose mutase [Burkholderiaceae bacterium]|nr:UDP-galactopyranose mutase [Burkholderiaceae bacterium]
MNRIAVVGAGFSGAVIAHELAADGHEVEVFESRPHVAGNCHTARDEESGILLHQYGPHIFHTSNPRVWDYVRRFDEFMPFTNRVKAVVRGRVYSMPVNLHTINQFFGLALGPAEARAFLASKADLSIAEPRTFEEQALRFMGAELYEAFFKGYTQKQWGMSPSELPASILRRLPLRFNYDDNYYASTWQGMPRHGYTHIVERLLDAPGIRVHLGARFERAMAGDFARVFYSGPIDAWFGNAEGSLGYRTLDFAAERHAGDFQGNAVINYCDPDVPWTRIAEHKHFAPWESHEATVIFRESSRYCESGDTPYYPIRLAKEKGQLARYIALAREEKNVSFVGRLGTYRYLDMHVTIAEALDWADRWRADGVTELPAFNVDPLG